MEDSQEVEVFISHRSTERDSLMAATLFAKLKERGITCFLDINDIPGGESFSHVILENIRRSRLVVVFIDEDMTSWIHFEASCAFFDQKLMPVSINGFDVPLPYGKIQHERVNINDDGVCDDEALERVADEVRRRLRGRPRDAVFTTVFRRLNGFFYSGLQILFVTVFAIVLLGYVPGTEYAHVHHLHVILGSAVLGGQFFLSLAFAKSVASPSFRERDYGFATTEKLFFVWIVLTVLQPALGLWLVLSSYAKYSMVGWVWFSIVLYVSALLCTFVGYVFAKSARDLDKDHSSPRSMSSRNLAANILFLLGFMLMVGVVNVMINKPNVSTETETKATDRMNQTTKIEDIMFGYLGTVYLTEGVIDQ